MKGENAELIYDALLKQLGEKYDFDKVKGGKFGAYMDVKIRNDGPVTLMIELDPNKVDKKFLKKLNKS